MKRIAAMLCAVLVSAGGARAGAPAAPEKVKVLELRAGVRAGEVRLKRLAADQHKEYLLIREREQSDLRAVKASASRGEALHGALLEVRERSRRLRLELRERRRGERGRLKQGLKNARAEIAAFRRKK